MRRQPIMDNNGPEASWRRTERAGGQLIHLGNPKDGAANAVRITKSSTGFEKVFAMVSELMVNGNINEFMFIKVNWDADRFDLVGVTCLSPYPLLRIPSLAQRCHQPTFIKANIMID